ncbi:unnamed protein product [Cunninghamella blakesleeana]
MKDPITEIQGQAWFDHLSEYYDIGEFPPLHSLTFGEWYLIIDDKDTFLSEGRLLTTKTCSFNNDIWTIIEEEKRPLYSDIVRKKKPDSSSTSLLSFHNHPHPFQNKKINNHYHKSRMMNDRIDGHTHDDYDDDSNNNLWLLSKSSYSDNRFKHQKNQYCQRNRILNQTSNPLVRNKEYKRKKEKRSRSKNYQTRFVQHQRKQTTIYR